MWKRREEGMRRGEQEGETQTVTVGQRVQLQTVSPEF